MEWFMNLSDRMRLVVVGAVVGVAVIIGLIVVQPKTSDIAQKEATARASAAASASASASASAASEDSGLPASDSIKLPLTTKTIQEQVATGQKELSIYVNPNLSGTEKNEQMRGATVTALIKDPQPAAAEAVPVPAVTFEKYVFMSEKQTEQLWKTDKQEFHIVFAVVDGFWKITDINSDGCPTNGPCFGIKSSVPTVGPN